jgi:3'(2'), 5'-bisphosphate nucleotidase
VSRSLLETLAAVTAAAGRIVLDVYGGEFRVEFKGPDDPVTAADRRANAALVQGLAAAFPGVPVVAEESDRAAYERYWEAGRILFVDPLDGTREFVDRNGEFAVMVGLVDGPGAAAGAVHAPVSGLTWVGAIGHGAWQVEADGRWSPVRVSAVADIAAAGFVVSRSHRSRRLQQALADLGPGRVRIMGSAGLKGAAVARGLADAYIDTGDRTRRWDVCAIDALVTAAGGRVSDLDGSPIDYRSRSLTNDRGLVVSNGRLHEAILAGRGRG